MSVPVIFLSAASDDLGNWRDLLHKAFERAGCKVHTQKQSFSASAGDVLALLRQHVDKSDFVIHLAGLAYGSEPEQPAFPTHPGFACPYTQFEYYYAHQQGKRVIAFVCAPDFPYQSFTQAGVDDADRERRRLLQLAHRERVTQGTFIGTPLEGHPHRPLSEQVADVNALLAAVAAAVGTIRDRMDAFPPLLDTFLPKMVSCVRALLLDGAAPPLGAAALPDVHSTPVSALPRPRIVNEAPAECPSYFQRRPQEEELGLYARDATCRLMVLCGRAGLGKTTLACRLLKEFEDAAPGASDPVAGVVYLGPRSSAVSFPNLVSGLCQLVAPEARQRLERLLADPKLGADETTRKLLAEFSAVRAFVLMDSFENVLDPVTFRIADPDLDAALRALLEAGRHGVKVVLTTRFKPKDLVRVRPGQQQVLEMDGGLGSCEGAAMLRAMDPDGHLGLRAAPLELLEEARRRAEGNPLALEMIKGILEEDGHRDLKDLLAADLPKDLTEALVGETFRRLGPFEQAVMQAIATCSTSTGPAATRELIDFLLRPFADGIDSDALLSKLVHLRLTTKASGVYSMRDADIAYALSQLKPGSSADWGDADGKLAFTQCALYHRAADWFVDKRVPKDRRKTRDDLGPHLTEFDLRAAAGEHDAASDVLAEIDFDLLAKWGLHRTVIDHRQRLEGKLSRRRRGYNVSLLGICHAELGRLDDAVRCHERGLAIAREVDAAGPEAAELEASELANLGLCRLDMGQTKEGLRLFGESLCLAQAGGDHYREGVALSNIGCCHMNIGDLTAAETHHRAALIIARELQHPRSEADRLSNLALCKLNAGQFVEAAALAAEADAAARLCDDSGARIEAMRTLAWGQLALGDMEAARDAADSAREIDDHATDYRAALVLGVVALRQGDDDAGSTAFLRSVECAEKFLSRCDRIFIAREVRGLALCGLALCNPAKRSRRARDAVAAFKAARALNRDAGVIAHTLHQLDAMIVGRETAAAVLAGARIAAAGGA